MDDFSKYADSPAHLAVARRDHVALQRIISAMPRLAVAGEVNTEEESLVAEQRADDVSAVIDRRDVPGRETPLHLAVRFRDATSVEILMAAGADWSLQNENGWSALQEAVCLREEEIAIIIARHYQPLAWAKWCRRLPRIIASAARIRDFYMEISFHFESSVIPFIGRIAPSDTYRIWKRGSNLRADMTLAGFDGFRIQRSDQSFLFLGESFSSDDGKICLAPGSLIVLSHKEKEVTNALEGAGGKPTEAEVAHEVALLSQTNMYRPGIDVTQAELVPHLNWRRQERTEMVGNWKSKVYDMLHVMVSVKSRRVPGAITDEELFSLEREQSPADRAGKNEMNDILTAEERSQLDSVIHMGASLDDISEEDECRAACLENGFGSSRQSDESRIPAKVKKGWLGWKYKGSRSVNDEAEDSSQISKCSKSMPEEDETSKSVNRRSPLDFSRHTFGDGKNCRHKSSKKKKKGAGLDSKGENEYKKNLRPVMWLTSDFPLTTEELLPFLDILAEKVKAIKRIRELLTTKLPSGTFPVKLAIPIVPTIRVLVTFTKFEELQPMEVFSTPPSSPECFQETNCEELDGPVSWFSWIRGSSGGGQPSDNGDGHQHGDEVDPFHIPLDYTWVDPNEKRRWVSPKKAKAKKQQKHQVACSGDGGQVSKQGKP